MRVTSFKGSSEMSVLKSPQLKGLASIIKTVRSSIVDHIDNSNSPGQKTRYSLIDCCINMYFGYNYHARKAKMTMGRGKY